MNCHCIPHNQIPNSTRLFTDYLYDFPRVSEFYSYPPLEDQSFSKAAQSINYSAESRRELVAVLRDQNQHFQASEKALENLRKLESPDCFAVVTGHQAGLFSGPAFGLYKGLSAVKLANALSKQGLPAVPVFWLATEDHDLDEVNHCYIQDRDGNPQRLEYPGEAPIAHAPVGSITFTEAILPLLEELRTLLPDSAYARELLSSLSECYRPGETFGRAFGRFLSRVFADFGVIMVDPMDRRLHKLSVLAFRVAVESAPAILDDLTERNRRLIEAGYHGQVHVSDSFSTLFYHVDGQRRALRLRDGRFVTAQGDSYSTGDLLKILEREPERISANVLLRPIMQDTLLPTVAYVAGPSEIAYMAQAAVVYRRILGRMPVIFPRASITVLDGSSKKLLDKYGLSLVDLFGGKQVLREKLAASLLPPDLTELFRRVASTLEEDIQAIQTTLAKVDPTLADAAFNSGRKMQYQLSTLEHKAATAIQHRSDQIERDALRLENSLYPAKTQQERLYSGISFLARYGPDFLHRLYEQIPLHSAQHQMIEL
jgi:bacillithiol biosynthesis cysteine-adding enzyme BshC